MTKEDILQLQTAHAVIYNAEIKPLYDKAREKEKELKEKFKIALNQYFDTLFIDGNGKIIKENDKLTLVEFEIKIAENPLRWRNEHELIRLSKMDVHFEKTGKTRNIEFVCERRSVQFLFGEMLNNTRIYVRKLRNGKKMKSEISFNPEECIYLKVIS